MPTLSDMIDEVKANLQGYTLRQDRITYLANAGGISTSATTVTIGSTSNLAKGVIEIEDELWAFVKKLFRSTKDKPKDMTEFKPIYISMIKNICDSDMIESKQVRDGKTRIRIYNLNIDYIKDHLKLNQYINPMANDFHNHFIEVLKIEPNEELLKQKNDKFKLLDY